MSDLAASQDRLRAAGEGAERYARLSRAESTLRAYRGDWARFEAWIAPTGAPSMPASPMLVAAYLAHLADGGQSVSTVSRALAAICQAHALGGCESPRRHPAVREVLRGIQRVKGVAQRGKRPLVLSELARVCHALPTWKIATRDRAILLLGFAGAFRRSELVALDLEDFELEDRGYVVRERRSKTDQVGEGRDVAIPYGSDPDTCPVRSLRAWIEASGITEGALFRHVDRHGHMHARLSAAAVAAIVKRYAELAGVDPRELGAHSLRSGLATTAAAAGKSERAIMSQTGHKSYAMVRRYIKRASLFDECGAVGIGL